MQSADQIDTAQDLTFDDGPSIYTDEILDILDRYHVKATFFVVGKDGPRETIIDAFHTGRLVDGVSDPCGIIC